MKIKIVKKRYIPYLILIAFGFCSNLYAEIPFSDLFASERQISSSNKDADGYRLALSQWKRINNSWVIDKEEIVAGRLVTRTLEIGGQRVLSDVVNSVDHYFSNEQSKELFRCDGLDCGSSNAWANHYFKEKQLYGLDSKQAYRVWRVTGNNKTFYISTYTVQRGNRRIYFQINTLEMVSGGHHAIAPNTKSILNTIEKNRFYRLPGRLNGSDFVVDESQLKPVAEALRANPVMRVFIVGHDYTKSSLEKQLQVSQGYAEKVASELIALGVPKQRLHAKGVGSLAPHSDQNKGAAVFLVIDQTTP